MRLKFYHFKLKIMMQMLKELMTENRGKSTFINLMMRLYDPERGQVLVDDIDVRDYNLADLRLQMGLVMQEPALFNYTIWENILYGRGDASNAQIREAAQIANALEFIEMKDSSAFDDDPTELRNAMLDD